MELLNSETEIKDIFKEFHLHPELSNEEYETTVKIKNILKACDIEIIELNLKTGLIAKIPSGKNGAVIALRADIDALPITEESGLEYSSVNKGVMHACGHDIHICSVLETARRLKKKQNELQGDVYFIFQPAEESAFGAKQIIETGILDRVDAIVSLHSNPDMDVGTFGIKSGSITASVDIFEFNITGTGAHGAKPEKSKDVIIAASALVMNLQTIVSRNAPPTESAVVSVTGISSGGTYNIIPDSAKLTGTVRTSDSKLRRLIKERIYQIIGANDAMYDVRTDIQWKEGPPATNNDKQLSSVAEKTVNSIGANAVLPDLSMVGEDFAFYQERKKGFMIWLGVGKGAGLHSPHFKADTNAIYRAADFFEKYISELQVADK